MKTLHSLGWSEQSVQIIINILCDEMEIPELTVMPLNHEIAINENLLGYYAGNTKGFYQMRILAENDMKTALHELCHHVQHCFSMEPNTPHDNTFSKATRKVVKTIRKKFGHKYFPGDHSLLRTRFSHNCESHYIFDEIKKSLTNES